MMTVNIYSQSNICGCFTGRFISRNACIRYFCFPSLHRKIRATYYMKEIYNK